MLGRFWVGLGVAVALIAGAPMAQAQSGWSRGNAVAATQDIDRGTAGWGQIPVTPAPAAGAGTTEPRLDPPNEFESWAVVVVAGDWRSSQGRPIQAFENSRRDLSQAFERAGFAPGNVTALSLAPNPDGTSLGSQRAFASIEATTQRATAGCLFYLTSHGSPSGIVFGPGGTMAPTVLDQLLDSWCGTRPTVVVVSACFSGVFVPALAQSNRMIMTAARRDRSSFGCSEDDTHPYFDACVLESLDEAVDFLALSQRTTGCVNRREREEGLRPPSEPQTYVGAQLQSLLPFLRFASP